MADVNETNNENQNAGNDQNNPSAGTKNTENKDGQQPAPGQDKEHMIPKTRFDEINSKFKETQKKLDELLTEREEADRKQKEKQGEFEDLYNKAKSEIDKFKGESKTMKDRVEALEGVINGLLEVKLEGVPEEYRDLIPDNLTPEQKLAWLNNAEKKGLFGKKQETPVGQQTNPQQQNVGDPSTLNPLQMLLAGYGKK